MEGDQIGTAVRHPFHIAFRMPDHQMHIKELVRDRPDRPDHRISESQLRHKASVHHIDMDDLGSALPCPENIVAQMAEICRQNRRRKQDHFASMNALTCL